MTVSQMTVSQMTVSQMTVSQMTVSQVTFSQKTVSQITVSQMAFNRMTLIIKSPKECEILFFVLFHAMGSMLFRRVSWRHYECYCLIEQDNIFDNCSALNKLNHVGNISVKK
jgi:hypothetical protein